MEKQCVHSSNVFHSTVRRFRIYGVEFEKIHLAGNFEMDSVDKLTATDAVVYIEHLLPRPL